MTSMLQRMVAEDLKQQVQTTFKLWGLIMGLDACKYMVVLLEPAAHQQAGLGGKDPDLAAGGGALFSEL